MTTAHRPTWKAAVGRAQEGGWTAGGLASQQSSAKDANAHTKLKFRKGSQVVSDKRAALQESLLKMEEAEKNANLTVCCIYCVYIVCCKHVHMMCSNI